MLARATFFARASMNAMVSSDIYGVRSRSNINCRSRTDRLRIPSKFKPTLFYSLAPRCPRNAFSSKLNNLSFVFPAGERSPIFLAFGISTFDETTDTRCPLTDGITEQRMILCENIKYTT